MAHSDVVPVGDAADWTYPPFSGHYDGEFVWGRGSLDDKSPLAAILEAATALLEAGFEPERVSTTAFRFIQTATRILSFATTRISCLHSDSTKNSTRSNPRAHFR